MMVETSLRDMFETLEGKWDLIREIPDGVSFEGMAVFKIINLNTIRLCETGNISMPDESEIAASRNWLWRCGEADKLEIFYDETVPRLYHSLSFVRNADSWFAEADHHCGQDIYHGCYRLAESVLVIDHKVRGPKKGYDLSSRYERDFN